MSAMFIDFRKAFFDTINHDLLLSKLPALIQALSFRCSSPEEQRQRAQINNKFSINLASDSWGSTRFYR